MGTTQFSTPSAYEIVMARVFDAPRRLVFEAHTKPEHVTRWMLGPDGWDMPVCEMDLRPGGAYRYVWTRGDAELVITGTYVEVTPDERVVTRERWGDSDWAETVNTLVLTEQDGRTTLVSTMRYPSEEARDAAMQSGMTHGVSMTYDRLGRYLSTME
jgi:uncharacterized protein YndB with AHSA1/START domain